MRIWSHTIVKNEERWIWYAVSSVINYVERVLIWDTGSSDNTIKIVKELIKKYPGKIEFREVGNVDPDQFTSVRGRMLERTQADWFIVNDADEIWWEDSIKKVVDTINKKGRNLESIVVPVKNLVGDIFHYQEEAAGNYKLAGRRGHLALKAINTKIPGLSSKNPHGTWGWVDSRGNMIQERDAKSMHFIDAPFLHTTHLLRGGARMYDLKTPKRYKKFKHELGIPFSLDFYYPEVFFQSRPDIVPSPWVTMDAKFFWKSLLLTPLRKIKRRLPLGAKVGY